MLAERWRAFGWQVAEVDGHSTEALHKAIGEPDAFAPPSIILAKTVIGKGVPYMEQGVSVTQTHIPVNPVNWHYLPMSDNEYATAIQALEGVAIA